MTKPEKTKKRIERKNKTDNYNKILKYLNIPFEMLVIIGLGTWGGIQLDRVFATKFPIFSVILIFLSIALAIYYVVKDLLK